MKICIYGAGAIGGIQAVQIEGGFDAEGTLPQVAQYRVRNSRAAELQLVARLHLGDAVQLEAGLEHGLPLGPGEACPRRALASRGRDAAIGGERPHATHRAAEQTRLVLLPPVVLHAFLLTVAFSILARRRQGVRA